MNGTFTNRSHRTDSGEGRAKARPALRNLQEREVMTGPSNERGQEVKSLDRASLPFQGCSLNSVGGARMLPLSAAPPGEVTAAPRGCGRRRPPLGWRPTR